MKTLEKRNNDILNKINSPFIIKRNEIDIKLIDFQKMNRTHLLQLEIKNLQKDNYRVFLKEHYLTLIITETKAIPKPIHVHNIDWNLVYNHDYDVMKNVDIWLPGDNFYLIKHYSIPEDRVLKIFLGQMHMN
jgi:hypothetical protein